MLRKRAALLMKYAYQIGGEGGRRGVVCARKGGPSRTMSQPTSVLPLCLSPCPRFRRLNLDEFYASGDTEGGGAGTLADWVVRESLPLVDALTVSNFPLYERLGLPMLLLFLVRTIAPSHAAT